jgi:uncharacterized membrane protein SpoIIM required for sporulation
MSNNNYFSKNFILALIISATIILSTILLASFIGSYAPQEEANQIRQEVENLATETWTDIFIHNFPLALVTFIPAFGIFFAVFMQFSTGYAFGAVAETYHVNGILLTLLALATPVGILEYSAYILALAESIILVYSIYKKEFEKRLINHTWKTLIAVALLLLIGAIVEALLIRL